MLRSSTSVSFPELVHPTGQNLKFPIVLKTHGKKLRKIENFYTKSISVLGT